MTSLSYDRRMHLVVMWSWWMSGTLAWVARIPVRLVGTSSSSSTGLDMAAVGIFYGTSTGNTQQVAQLLYEALGSEVAAAPMDVDSLPTDDPEALAEILLAHDALLVGTPTWNTGADTERSGTNWDELYYQTLPACKSQLQGKKVAVFGLGDQISYGENYADATGELYDVFAGLGCTMLGAWSQEGYKHKASKSVRGDKFCGLVLDMINQEDLTPDRVQRWVAQLRQEGLLDASLTAPVDSATPATAAPVKAAGGAGSVGIFYGTSTGNTAVVADKIYQALLAAAAGTSIAEPMDVDTLGEGNLAERMGKHTALVVGTPTWNTGADTERSGTNWDELYYQQLPELKEMLQGKKVAVFGLGDQVSYAENYADATGELYDVFESLGCAMLGAWSQEGYKHKASKSIRGDKFCGLLLDMINQEGMTDDRVERWVVQLQQEGLFQAGGSAAVPAKVAPAQAPVAALPEPQLQELQANSRLLDQNIGSHSSGGFVPHYNPVTRRTMWTSSDGRKSFVTLEAKTQLFP